VRPVALVALCGAFIEIGWLAVWSLSGALSHSPLFTSAFLEAHPAAKQLFGVTLWTARRLVPGLPEVPLAEPLGSDVYAVPAAALGAVMVWLALAYTATLLLLGRGVGKSRATVWLVVGSAVVFQATLALLPGLFSQDVFSYVAYGRLASVYDLNPYIWPPNVIPRDAVVPWVAEVWRSYTSPYGPLWIDVQWAMARLTSDRSIADQALAFRLLANVLLLANLGLVWSLLGRLSPLSYRDRTVALAALAWNPLVLLEVSANAHNDVLMVTFTLLALLLWTRSRNALAASASLTLGALVKYLSGIGLIWLALAEVAWGESWARRLLALAGMVVVSLVLLVGLADPWLELPDSIGPLLNETAGVGYVNSLPDSLALALARSVSASVELARTFERLVVLTGFAAYLVWEARRVCTQASPAAVARALARSTLIFVLAVSTSVQTWYFCLPVAVAVALGCRWRVTQVGLAYSLLALPALYLNYYLRDSTPGWVNLVYGVAPLLLVIPDLAAWARARAHVPAAERVGDNEQRAGRNRLPRAVVEEARR
jgi:hypothetical protein